MEGCSFEQRYQCCVPVCPGPEPASAFILSSSKQLIDTIFVPVPLSPGAHWLGREATGGPAFVPILFSHVFMTLNFTFQPRYVHKDSITLK